MAARLLETGPATPRSSPASCWTARRSVTCACCPASLGRAVLEPGQAGGLRPGVDDGHPGRPGRRRACRTRSAEDVIDVVRRTDEAEVAVVFKESDDGVWHVSARSKGRVDVARAAVALGGGGHSQAAGFTTDEAVPDALARLRALLAVPDGPGRSARRPPTRRRPAAATAPGGLVIVDKPAGLTSHDVVARVRRLAGPAGSATPARSTRWPPACWWSAWRRRPGCSGHLALTEKDYSATIRLGQATDTDDAEGDDHLAARPPARPDERPAAAAAALHRRDQQVPPRSARSRSAASGPTARPRRRGAPARAAHGDRARAHRASRAPPRRPAGPGRDGDLLQRHLHPCAGPRPRRGARRRRAPDRGCAAPGSARTARGRRADARAAGRRARRAAAGATRPRPPSPGCDLDRRAGRAAGPRRPAARGRPGARRRRRRSGRTAR